MFLMLDFQHFNPRSHKGSDLDVREDDSYNAISIHAPTRGATITTVQKDSLIAISIHAPTRGATS